MGCLGNLGRLLPSVDQTAGSTEQSQVPAGRFAGSRGLSVLAEVWGLSPDGRIGQLFADLGFLGDAHVGKGWGDIEDDELMAVLDRHRGELLARSQGAPDYTLPPAGAATSVSGSSAETAR